MSLRVAALDYLGVVAAKLRRDAVTSFTDVRSVVALLERLEEASKEDVPDKEPTEEEEQKEEKAEEPKKEVTLCSDSSKNIFYEKEIAV